MENFESLFDISGKTAVVTGGASGIGAMITESLVDAGVNVIIASRKADALNAFADAMNKKGKGQVTAVAADLITAEGTEGLAAAIADKVDKIDILVNNSGAAWGATLADFPRDAWDKILTLNVTAVADLTRLLLPLLRKDTTMVDPSRIINIGSVMGTRPAARLVGDTGAYSYVASKAAVHHLTRTLANELARDHITVNALAPGPFPSKMTASVTDTEEKREMMGKTVPLGRVGEPEDMNCVVRWLCSKGGAYISGNIIAIDGGMSAMP